MLIAVNYHYIKPEFNYPYKGIYGIKPEELLHQLELLARAGNFVSANDVRSALHGEKELPERSIIVTFDDGLKDQIEFAYPVLHRLGVPAIFFRKYEFHNRKENADSPQNPFAWVVC